MFGSYNEKVEAFRVNKQCIDLSSKHFLVKLTRKPFILMKG